MVILLPTEEIAQVQPGEIFFHRNVANLVVHMDMLSVL
ncbi:carbonic anhydrase [Spirosoma sp. KCTC 42546]